MKNMKEKKMSRTTSSSFERPQARQRDIVVQELAGETLVYDLERHRAHCLSATAAWVWQHCDGKTPPAVLARRLSRELGRPVGEDVVGLALHRLAKARLLESTPASPSLTFRARRDLLKKAALLGGLSVLSMVAPAVGQAATCIERATCEALPNASPTCAGQPCCGMPGKVCVSQACGNRCCCRNPP
jgi:coenzyme PQQ synthesis protein D (PqqD)